MSKPNRATDRIRAALKTAPAGRMREICKDLCIDPRQILLVSDAQADQIIERLQALGASPKIDYSQDVDGDGAVFVSGRKP